MTDITYKLPMSARYHYARLKYQYKKLPLIRQFNELTGNIEFELYSFFEICYHLKDWLKLDKTYPPTQVENFINDTPALRITADICNRLKHGELNKKPRSKDLGYLTTTLHIRSGTGSTKDTISVSSAKVETERGIECCFSLADECMREWEKYIEKYF